MKETKAISRRRERLALPLAPSQQTSEGERAWGSLVLETRPIGGGRDDNAEDVSQRNWTTEQALPAPATFRKVPVWVTPQPIRFPSCFPTPSRRLRKETMGSWETRHTSNLEVPREPRLLPPLPPPPGTPRLAADWHGRGWGSSTAPGPRFAKSRASAACRGTFAHGHALPADAAPRDPLLSSSSSLATLPNYSRPFNHSQL